MSGETEQNISGWTVDTLREHFEHLLEELDRRNEQRFEATEKAITKAEVATEKRFEGVNEFRQQLGDQATSFMPRLEAEQRIAQNAEKVDGLSKRISESDFLSRTEYQSRHDDLVNQVNEIQGYRARNEGAQQNVTQRQASVLVIVAVASVFVALVSVGVAVAALVAK